MQSLNTTFPFSTLPHNFFVTSTTISLIRHTLFVPFSLYCIWGGFRDSETCVDQPFCTQVKTLLRTLLSKYRTQMRCDFSFYLGMYGRVLHQLCGLMHWVLSELADLGHNSVKTAIYNFCGQRPPGFYDRNFMQRWFCTEKSLCWATSYLPNMTSDGQILHTQSHSPGV